MAEPVGALRLSGVSQCYQCGYGRAGSGAVVSKWGFLPEISDYHLPRIDNEAYKRCSDSASAGRSREGADIWKSLSKRNAHAQPMS
jgi:hypothetical protein